MRSATHVFALLALVLGSTWSTGCATLEKAAGYTCKVTSVEGSVGVVGTRLKGSADLCDLFGAKK